MTDAEQEQEPSIEEILSSIRRIISEDDEENPDSGEGGELKGDADDGKAGGGELKGEEDNLPKAGGGELKGEEDDGKAGGGDLKGEEDNLPKAGGGELKGEDESEWKDGKDDDPKPADDDDDEVLDLTQPLDEPDDTETDLRPKKDSGLDDSPIPYEDDDEDGAGFEIDMVEGDEDDHAGSLKGEGVDKDKGGRLVGDDDHLLSDPSEDLAAQALARLARNIPVDRNTVPGGITLECIVRELLRPMLADWLDTHLPKIIEKMVQKELERVTKRALDE